MLAAILFKFNVQTNHLEILLESKFCLVVLVWTLKHCDFDHLQGSLTMLDWEPHSGQHLRKAMSHSKEFQCSLRETSSQLCRKLTLSTYHVANTVDNSQPDQDTLLPWVSPCNLYAMLAYTCQNVTVVWERVPWSSLLEIKSSAGATWSYPLLISNT
jgi:hypothetical protein